MQLEDVLAGIQPIETQWIQQAKSRTAQLVMPSRALGRLHDIAERLCGIQQSLKPAVDRKAILVMAADHGVVEEGVTAYPSEVTAEMVRTFLRNGAGINVLARWVDSEVWVVDMGVASVLDTPPQEGGDRLYLRKIAPGTANMARGPAMTPEQATQAVLVGFELASGLIQDGVQLLGTGDMGIGNTTPSAAIGTLMTGKDVEEMVGRGAGVDDTGLERKRKVISKAIEVNTPDPSDGLDVLAKIGGFEIGGIAGTILAAAHHRRPVVIDGLIATAGALVAHALCPTVRDYIFAGHRSKEPGHGAMLAYLGLESLLDLEMRLGEGTGAALAMGIIQAAVDVFRHVMTFEEAGVLQDS